MFNEQLMQSMGLIVPVLLAKCRGKMQSESRNRRDALHVVVGDKLKRFIWVLYSTWCRHGTFAVKYSEQTKCAVVRTLEKCFRNVNVRSNEQRIRLWQRTGNDQSIGLVDSSIINLN
jgi:hypothetical protein